MSLILEALKKSEANRRLGEAPDLATPFTLKRRRRSPVPLIALAIIVLGALAWWFVRVPESTSPAPAGTAPKAAAPAIATTAANGTDPNATNKPVGASAPTHP